MAESCWLCKRKAGCSPSGMREMIVDLGVPACHMKKKRRVKNVARRMKDFVGKDIWEFALECGGMLRSVRVFDGDALRKQGLLLSAWHW